MIERALRNREVGDSSSPLGNFCCLGFSSVLGFYFLSSAIRSDEADLVGLMLASSVDEVFLLCSGFTFFLLLYGATKRT